MKILLVFPNMGTITGEPPMGIGYLASYLEKNGFRVKILDTTFKPSFSYVEEAIRQQKPDVVGIYTSTVMLNDSLRSAEIAKSYNIPLVIMGGPHASILPLEVLGNKNVDAIVVGEGEYSFTKIIEKFEKTGEIKDLFKIPNVYAKINEKIKISKNRFFIKNLDDIPFPARHHFDMEEYIKHWFQLDAVSPKLRGTNICFSRSCPFSCTFCQPTLKKIFGQVLRRRSPENIINELNELKNKYSINAVQSVDDMFFMDEKYLENFCMKIIKEDTDMIWGCQSRVDTIPTDRILKLAYNAGLRMVSLGIESGSPRILKFYNKKITLQQVKTAIKKLKLNNIKIRGYFILGAPTETLKEIKETIKFATNLKLDEAAFSVLTPFPGTYIFDMIKTAGWDVNKEWNYESYYSRGGFLKGALPERIIRMYQRLAFLTFYSHPYRLKYLVSSVLNFRRAFAKINCYFL